MSVCVDTAEGKVNLPSRRLDSKLPLVLVLVQTLRRLVRVCGSGGSAASAAAFWPVVSLLYTQLDVCLLVGRLVASLAATTGHQPPDTSSFRQEEHREADCECSAMITAKRQTPT